MADKFRVFYECVGGVDRQAHGYISWTVTSDNENGTSACQECGRTCQPLQVDKVDPPPPPSQDKIDEAHFDQHDLLGRLFPGEPYFVIAARDFRASYIAKIYAAAREAKFDAVLQHVAQLEIATKRHAKPSPKDVQHAWAAREKARQMDEWRIHNVKGQNVGNRVNSAPDRDLPAAPDLTRTDYTGIAGDDAGYLAATAAYEALKRAKPNREPDEAN